ncbi:site-specific integrase [Streptomyces sp. M10(2022)]
MRASELIGMRQRDVDSGQQLISVVRKGSRAVQQVPASADAFVWLRLYQHEVQGQVARGRTQPVWWTRRDPIRPLTYHGAHRMFERVNASLGADWTIHDLRHSAAARIVRDPKLTLSDVQWVLGHAHLSATEVYLTPHKDEVVAGCWRTTRARPARTSSRRLRRRHRATTRRRWTFCLGARHDGRRQARDAQAAGDHERDCGAGPGAEQPAAGAVPAGPRNGGGRRPRSRLRRRCDV